MKCYSWMRSVGLFLIFVVTSSLVSIAARGRGGGGGRGGRGWGRGSRGRGGSGPSSRIVGGNVYFYYAYSELDPYSTGSSASDERSSAVTMWFVFLVLVVSFFVVAALALVLKFVVNNCCYPDDDLELSTDPKVKRKDSERLSQRLSQSVRELNERQKRRRRRSKSRERKRHVVTPTAPPIDVVEDSELQHLTAATAVGEPPPLVFGLSSSVSEFKPETIPELEVLQTDCTPPRTDDACASARSTHLPLSERMHRRARRHSETTQVVMTRARSSTREGSAFETRVMIRQLSAPLPTSAQTALELGFRSEEEFLEGPPTYEESLTHSTQSIRDLESDSVSLHL